jgi:hypothetical protein
MDNSLHIGLVADTCPPDAKGVALTHDVAELLADPCRARKAA